MATVVLGAIGAGIGSIWGASSIGWSVGVLLAGALYGPKQQSQSRGRLTDIPVSGSSYGTMVPIVFGQCRVPGNYIWATDLIENKHTTHVGPRKKGQDVTDYFYTCSFAVLICEGVVPGIRRIWADSEIIYDSTKDDAEELGWTFYTGTEGQLPDPTIEEAEGAGNVPAYRSWCYAVAKDHDLTNYGNRLPNLSFEIAPESVTSGTDPLDEGLGSPSLPVNTWLHVRADSVPGLEGSTVTQWFDESGLTPNHDMFGTSTLLTNAANGHRALRFSAANDQMQTQVFGAQSFNPQNLPPAERLLLPVTVMGAIRLRHTHVSGNTGFIWGGLNSNNGIPSAYGVNAALSHGGVHGTVLAASNGGGGTAAMDDGAVEFGDWQVVWAEYDNDPGTGDGTIRFSVDGGPIQTGVFTGSTSYVGVFGFTLGNVFGGAADMDVAEVIVWDRKLAAGERVGNISYLRKAYQTMPAFKPKRVTDVAFWYDSTVVPGNDNQTFNRWGDRSTLHRDLLQNSASNQLKVRYDGPNGRRVAESAAGKWMSYATALNETIFSSNQAAFYAVIKQNAASVRNHLIAQSGSGNTKILWAWSDQDDLYTDYGNSATTPDARFHANPQPSNWDDTWHVVEFVRFSDGSAELSVDGLKLATGTMSGSFTDTHQALYLGDLGGPFAFGGEIAALLAYSSVPVIADREKILGYLALKYGQTSATVTLSTSSRLDLILENIFRRVGLQPAQYDVSDVSEVQVTGFPIGQRTEARAALEPVLSFYQTDLAEFDGKVWAFQRGRAITATIPAEDMGTVVWSGGDSGTGPREGDILTRRIPELELPSHVDLTYFASPVINSDGTITGDYNQGSQGAERYTKPLQNPLTINTPLTLTPDDARQGAERALYLQWLEREQSQLSLPWRWLHLVPSDVVNVPVGTSLLRMRIIGQDIGLFGPVALTLVLDDVSVLDQNAPGQPPTPYVRQPIVDDTALVAWSGNALRDEDTDRIGLYLAAAGAQPGLWTGAVIYWSRDGTNYEALQAIADAAPIGTTATTLAPYDKTAHWDTQNTLDVTLYNGTLESTSDSAVLNGANAVLVGDEVIQFVTATSIGTNQYRLSRLLRGRRGTDPFWAAHAVGERVVALDPVNVKRVALDDSLIGATVQLKAVGVGQTVASQTAVPLVITGRERYPYTVAHIRGRRETNDDIILTWIRRTRKGGEWQDYTDAALSETVERYDVALLNGAVVVRAWNGLTVPTLTYTAGEQLTDWGALSDTLTIRIWQLGQYGHGYPQTVTLDIAAGTTTPAYGTMDFSDVDLSGLMLFI